MAEREEFERLVAASARTWTSVGEIRAELDAQAATTTSGATDGLDALAEVLARRLAGGSASATAELDRVAALEPAHPGQPLVHLYACALNREAGAAAAAAAAASLDALLALEPDEPLGLHLDAARRGRPLDPVPEASRLVNIARIASTPLLANPYSLAVGALFESIRDRERARVLDVGVGGGAQMAGLIDLLRTRPHRIRRLEIAGLDFQQAFLAQAGERIAAATAGLAGAVEVVYEPVEGRVESIDERAIARLRGDGEGLDAANASISLHEVAGEAKLDALANLRALAPRRLVVAEWNFCLENILPETSTEFVWNVRRCEVAFVSALRDKYGSEVARGAVRDWLAQGDGQLTCPAAERQECFLDAESWRVLLEHSGFELEWPGGNLLGYAAHPEHASVGAGGWFVATSSYGGHAPVALIVASPAAVRPARGA